MNYEQLFRAHWAWIASQAKCLELRIAKGETNKHHELKYEWPGWTPELRSDDRSYGGGNACFACTACQWDCSRCPVDFGVPFIDATFCPCERIDSPYRLWRESKMETSLFHYATLVSNLPWDNSKLELPLQVEE